MPKLKGLPPNTVVRPWITSQVSRVATQAVADSTNVAASFDRVDRNDLAVFDPTNPTKFTVTIAGWYLFQAQANWNITTPYRIINSRFNGSVYVSRDDLSNICQLTHSITTIRYLNANDYVEFIVFRIGGLTTNITGSMALSRLL